jgi:hypothetical protein
MQCLFRPPFVQQHELPEIGVRLVLGAFKLSPPPGYLE